MVSSSLYLGLFPEFMIKKELNEERLIACLIDYQLAAVSFYAIYPIRELMPPKVKVFISMLKEHMASLK